MQFNIGTPHILTTLMMPLGLNDCRLMLSITFIVCTLHINLMCVLRAKAANIISRACLAGDDDDNALRSSACHLLSWEPVIHQMLYFVVAPSLKLFFDLSFPCT